MTQNTYAVDMWRGICQASIIELICDALRDLVAFVQLKKRERHPWRSVNLSKVAGFSLQLD